MHKSKKTYSAGMWLCYGIFLGLVVSEVNEHLFGDMTLSELGVFKSVVILSLYAVSVIVIASVANRVPGST